MAAGRMGGMEVSAGSQPALKGMYETRFSFQGKSRYKVLSKRTDTMGVVFFKDLDAALRTARGVCVESGKPVRSYPSHAGQRCRPGPG